jgi:hypothetical protein
MWELKKNGWRTFGKVRLAGENEAAGAAVAAVVAVE